MPRLVRVLLLAVMVMALSGIAPAAAALADDCGEEEPGCAGEDEGCPPLCTSCVCGTWVPAIDLHVDAVEIASQTVLVPPCASTPAIPDPPLRDVFHPPRVRA